MASDAEDLLLVLGNNIDKRNLVEINKKIGGDKDILRLLRRGRAYYLALLVVIVLSFCATVGGILDAIDSLASVRSTAVSLAGVVVLVISIYGAIDGVRSSIGDSISLPTYLRCIFSRDAPRHPSQLWQLIQGSVADAQLAAAAQRIWHGNVHTVFAGRPYYSIKIIDSLVIQWKDSSLRTRMATRRRYGKFLREFSSRTMAAATGEKFFDVESMALEKSNSVFGVLFFSTYLKRELEYRATSLRGKVRVALRTDSSDFDEDGDLLPGCQWRYVKEFVEYCTTPDSLQWVDCTESPDLVICGASFLTSGDKQVRMQRGLLGTLRLPVKRAIAIAEGGGVFPSCIDSSRYVRIVSIGGAEQSLALQHILNYCRWHSVPGVRVGFAENAFENYLDMDFLAGTEGLVYGVNVVVRGRDDEKFTPKEAEVFYAKIGVWEFYSVYGYSALLTKMSLCTLIDALGSVEPARISDGENVEPECDIPSRQELIPGRATMRKPIIGYRLKCDADRKGFYNSAEVRRWDERDVINSTTELLKWLGEWPVVLRDEPDGASKDVRDTE